MAGIILGSFCCLTRRNKRRHPATPPSTPAFEHSELGEYAAVKGAPSTAWRSYTSDLQMEGGHTIHGAQSRKVGQASAPMDSPTRSTYGDLQQFSPSVPYSSTTSSSRQYNAPSSPPSFQDPRYPHDSTYPPSFHGHYRSDSDHSDGAEYSI